MDEHADKPKAAGVAMPAALLDRLGSLFPGFRAQWEATDNYYIEADGSFSYCGVFAELSHFFRERFGSIPQPALEEFGTLISECMICPSSELDTAAATCFLENMAYERFSAELKRYLCGNALEFFSQFDDRT
jgi:hypothetical protein